MIFALDPRLEASSAFVADLPLCQVRLQNDARWPWLVLVPRRAELRELDDLDASERATLIEEIVLAGRAVRRLGPLDKLNVGALGNIVAQLHVHVVGRTQADEAWPDPVWGRGEAVRYGRDRLARCMALAAEALAA